MWILLFSEVTLFEYNVSKISSLIVSLVRDLSFLDDHDRGENCKLIESAQITQTRIKIIQNQRTIVSV